MKNQMIKERYDVSDLALEKPEDMYKLLSTNETAARLHTTRKKVGWFRKYGLLPTRKLGKAHVITVKELCEFLELTKDADLGTEGDIITFANSMMKIGRLGNKKRIS